MVSIDVQGWHAEREVAVAEMLRYDALLGWDLPFLWNLGKHLMCTEPVINKIQTRTQTQEAEKN